MTTPRKPRIGCPGNQMIIGIDSNGVVDCGDPPPVGCPTQPVNNCGDTRNLLAAPHGDTQTLTFGTNVGNLYTQVFQCNAGAWNLLSTTGLCSCTPNVWNVQNNVSCADSDNNPCGSRYSGDLDRQTQRVCPSGNVNTVITRNGCVCQNTWGPDTTRSCATHWFRGLVPTQPPSGYSWNTGNVTAAREHVCSSTTSGSCSGYQYQSHNCGCSNGTPYQVVRACSNGAPADEIVTRQFVCNGGGGVGDYGQDVQISVDTTACTCPVGSTPGTPRACTSPTVPIAPHTGVPTTVTWSSPGPGVCTSVTTEDGPESSYCEAPPPLTCVWKRKTGALPIAGTAILTHGVDSCDCSADAGVEPLCSQGGQAYTCSCQVN